jgi:hypothetical protein
MITEMAIREEEVSVEDTASLTTVTARVSLHAR